MAVAVPTPPMGGPALQATPEPAMVGRPEARAALHRSRVLPGVHREAHLATARLEVVLGMNHPEAPPPKGGARRRQTQRSPILLLSWAHATGTES